MFSTRSTTGCLACKAKRKKCDETKPHCLRCRKSRTKCPGYTYIQNSNNPKSKIRTLPAPRTLVSRSRALAHQAALLANTKEPYLQPPDHLSIDNDQVTFDAPYGVQGTSVLENCGALSELSDKSNAWSYPYSFTGSLHDAPTRLNASQGLAILPTTDPVLTPPSMSMTAGQASLLEALFSLGQPPHLDLSLSRTQPITHLLPNPSVPLATTWSPFGVKQQGDVTTHGDEDPEGIIAVIRRQPVLDKTAESNTLPFVLQSYAIWISRMAFEPSRLATVAREFVFNQFEGGEQSRWIIGLLANVGSRIGSVELMEGKHNPLITALQSAVRRRLGAAKSRPNPSRSELAKAFDSTTETMLIHCFIRPFSEVTVLRQETASVFRQLCSESLNAPINLPSLLQHPLSYLQHYAEIDIMFSIYVDLPISSRYEVVSHDNQPSDLSPLGVGIQSDGILQWLHGIPNQIILLFAKMKTMRENGSTSNEEAIMSLEQDIREILPYIGSSADRFLAIMRSVVQECWRQAAFVYLYMAVCGDPCDTPRVKKAFKRFMNLLNGTKPGRLPDDFLSLPLALVSPVAQRQRDREAIRLRVLEFHRRGQAIRANNHITRLVEDYWARADTERRPITWSDVAVSQRRVLGV